MRLAKQTEVLRMHDVAHVNGLVLSRLNKLHKSNIPFGSLIELICSELSFLFADWYSRCRCLRSGP